MNAKQTLDYLFLMMSTATLMGVNIESTVDDLLNKGREADLSTISEPDRPLIVTELKKRISGTKALDKDYSISLLLNLGDDRTVKEVVEAYKRFDARDVRRFMTLLRDSKQPLVIPLLAGDLDLNEQAKWQVIAPELVGLPRSFTSAEIIRRIIATSVVFPKEIREWASTATFSKAGEFGNLKSLLRQWWKENEEHFKKKDYAAVRPPKNAPAAPPAEKK